MIPFLDVGQTYAEIKDELDAAYHRVMDSGWFIMGRELEAFEAEFADYCGASHAVGVASGLDALILPLRVWGIGPGDEVLVPDFTFVASWLAVSAVGATPVPVACDAFFALDARSMRDAITEHTRAVMPVHLYGQPADMTAIGAIAREYNLFVLEDAAQAHGATLHGERAGTLGDAAGFSFYPGKNLGAFGDGGAIVTNDADFAAACRRFRNYGSEKKYHHIEMGTNSRLDELQAAFLRVKLAHLDDWNTRRDSRVAQYEAGLSETPLVLPEVRPGAKTAWHLYVVQTDTREALTRHLTDRGVQTGIHYPIAPARQPCYQGQIPASEQADRWADTVLSLPLGPHLSADACATVIQEVCAFYG